MIHFAHLSRKELRESAFRKANSQITKGWKVIDRLSGCRFMSLFSRSNGVSLVKHLFSEISGSLNFFWLVVPQWGLKFDKTVRSRWMEYFGGKNIQKYHGQNPSEALRYWALYCNDSQNSGTFSGIEPFNYLHSINTNPFNSSGTFFAMEITFKVNGRTQIDGSSQIKPSGGSIEALA